MRARLVDPAHAGVREAWARLARTAAEPNPFFEPEAVVPAARLLADGSAVRLLVVQDGPADDAELHLVLPVVPTRYRRLPLRALGSWQHQYCYAGAPLISASGGQQAWAVALAALRDLCAERWLVLPRIPVDGPAAAALRAALAEVGTAARATDGFDRPVVHRRPDDDYLEGRFGSRSRKSLRRQQRRLETALGGPVTLVDAAADPAAVPGAVEVFLAVESSGWKGVSGTALASDPGSAELFRRLCAGFAGQGRLQLWSLGVPGRPAAVQANLLAGGTVYHYKIAYADDLGAYSPGLQLEIAMLEEFHRDTRLERLDSCTDPGPTVSARLYPDTQRLATLLVPLDRSVGRLAVRTAPAVVGAGEAARRRLRALRSGRAEEVTPGEPAEIPQQRAVLTPSASRSGTPLT